MGLGVAAGCVLRFVGGGCGDARVGFAGGVVMGEVRAGVCRMFFSERFFLPKQYPPTKTTVCISDMGLNSYPKFFKA